MLRRFVLLLLLIVLTGLSVVHAQQPMNMSMFTLENGLEVILVEDHSAPTVAVSVWYHVGGANDPAGRSGFAHLFEHMMFQGSQNVDKGEIDRQIVAAGGDTPNAYTSIEHTSYYLVVPSNQLPLALWLEADRMGALDVSQENLDNQAAVVIEELNQRVTNSPYGEAIQQLFTLPYEYAPFQKRVIGSVENIDAATLEEVTAFHDTYYAPNNATLVIAGDINPEQARELVEKFFGGVPARAEPPVLPDYTPAPRTEPQLVTSYDPLANVPAVLMGYNAPPRGSADYAAVDILNRILGVGNSSRLAVALVDTGEALAAETGLDGNRGPSLFYVILVPNVGKEPAAIEAKYYAEVQRIIDDGVSEDELAKAINGLRSQRIVSLETALDLAESVQAANFYLGDPQQLFTEIDSYTKVTVADIQRVAKEYLAPERRTVITVIPGAAPADAATPPASGGEAGAPLKPPEATGTFVAAQTTAPEPLPATTFTLPEIKEATLSNGMSVIYINRRELPIISLDVFLPGGASAEPADKSGLADLTAAVWTRGTTTRTAQEINSTIEQVGGFMGAEAGDDSLSAGVFALREDIDLAFELLGDVVLHPTFPETEVSIARDNLLTDLQFELSDPGALAERVFNRIIYGDHPYGSASTEASLGGLTQADALSFYQSQLDPARAFLVVTGDISFEDAMTLAEKTFGSMTAAGDSAAVTYPALPEHTGLKIYLIDRPGSTQAQILMGNPGVPGNSPLRPKLRVMNEIFGGGFTSRLTKNVREEKGYTYGIYSYFIYPADMGIFAINAAVGNDVVDKALNAIFEEITRMQTEEVPAAELNDTKTGIIGSFALSLETYQSFVNQLSSYKLRGIPLESLAQYNTEIDAVTAADVKQIALDFIQAQNMVIVVVGDASVIQAQLESIAPVTVVEVE